jgi:hypothetical protein
VVDRGPLTRFRPNPLAVRWLRADAAQPSEGANADWAAWLLRRMSRGEIALVGGVLVDRAVLRQRFACVPERCAPRPGRGAYRSCCADAFVPLSRAEDRRLAHRGGDLLRFMKAREPRLAGCAGGGFYRGQTELGLARPDGRCVFSEVDDVGRILCRLHGYAKRAGIDRGALQPVTCRLFPLIVVDCANGRTVLTVVASHTFRLVGAYPPRRYPCLDDAALPPLYEAMRSDLDWLFGRGFADALAQAV